MVAKRSRGSMAVTLLAASGSLCLALAASVAMGGQRSVVEAAPLGTAEGAAVVAVSAPSTTGTPPDPGFRATAVAGTAGGVPLVLALPGRPDIPVDPVGQTVEHGIDIPDDPHRAGWWAAGSAPGDETGSTVLVGHLDSATHGVGAFADLLDLALGDEVTVRDSTGTPWTYTVTGREQFRKESLPASVFTTQGPQRLVLVTCGGRFDPVARHYDDNVVVTAEPKRG